LRVEGIADQLDEFVVQIYTSAVLFNQSAQTVQKFAARVEAYTVQKFIDSQQELPYARQE
jgi:hypothetical protein